MTPSPTEVAAIAERLTEAQRWAVRSLYQDPERHAPYHLFPNTRANRKSWRDMIGKGLVTSEDDGFNLVITRNSIVAMVELTPLGLAVRQHLQEIG